MKKITFMACAAMLTSAIAFTGCNSKDQNGPVGPKEVVKTEFAISIPESEAGGPRKMPSTTVPENGSFYGINALTLIPFAKTTSPIISSDTRLDANIVLGNIAAGTADLGTNSHAKLFTNISVPLSTASFLVYGQSAADGTSAQKGVLTPNDLTVSNLANIEFQLSPIVASTVSVTADGVGATLLGYLNDIADVTDGAGTPKAWAEYTASDNAIMAALFTTFTSLKGLSSFGVERVVNDLYNSVMEHTSDAAPIGTLATNIKNAIEVGANVDASGAPVYVVTLKSGYTGFPADKNLPDGAVQIKYAAGSFSALVDGEYTAASQIPLKDYVYPSSLWFYGNSLIKADDSQKGATLYNNSNVWADILADYNDGAVVSATTHSIAIVSPIQYAVGRLNVTVALESTTLADKADHTITSNASGFPVTAVLIGNQKNVGFNFLPKGTTSYTMYDKIMTNTMNAYTTPSAANSTLVVETPATEVAAGTTDGDADVQIAIELENNSVTGDFIGANGQLIPAGGKFYLVATLKASNATTTEKRVFIQDYVTTANLTISSLANAYNTIPDLRTPKLQVGVSVDLNWTSGSTYNVTIP